MVGSIQVIKDMLVPPSWVLVLCAPPSVINRFMCAPPSSTMRIFCGC